MKDVNEIIEVLKSVKEFSSLSDKEKEHLSESLTIETYNAGDEVFSLKDKGEFFCIVSKGWLSLRLKSGKFREYTERGEIFGEITVFNNNFRFGSVKAVENSRLVIFPKSLITKNENIPKELMNKVIIGLTNKIIGYLDEQDEKSTTKLIQKGESYNSEFKSSIHDKNLNDIVKTIIAFMNVSGGTVIIGVNDKGRILGINKSHDELDEYRRKILGKIYNHISSVRLKN